MSADLASVGRQARGEQSGRQPWREDDPASPTRLPPAPSASLLILLGSSREAPGPQGLLLQLRAVGEGGWPHVSVSGVLAPRKEGALRTEPPGMNRCTKTPLGPGGKTLILILFKLCSKKRGK